MDIPTKLFEVAENLKAISVACNFVDVGRYSSLYQLLPKDGERNAVVGSAILRGDCRGNLAINHTDKPLVIIDQQDMVIVQTSEGNVCAPYASIDTIGAIYKSELLG
jgi:mannose-1-phosphate guanylyltransferase